MASQAPRPATKVVSSRLLSMKFMQRAVADAEEEPLSPKRRKVSHPSKVATPVIDREAMRAALEEDDRKRQVAIEKQAEELGDSHWVLDVAVPAPKLGGVPQAPLNIVPVGFAQIDTPDSSGGSWPASAADHGPSESSNIRRFNMTKKKTKETKARPGDTSGSRETRTYQQRQAAEKESDMDSDESGSSDDGPSGSSSPFDRGRERVTTDGSRKRTRSDVSRKRSAERAKAHEYAEKRRKKEVNLNRLTSISSQGGPSILKCYRCGKTGHKAQQCPSNGKR